MKLFVNKIIYSRQNTLIVAFLLIIQSTFSQIEKTENKVVITDKASSVSIDPICFVLGTLSDYNSDQL